MTDYNFGDIVLVPFPFTDQSTVKKRPAVIVSSDAYNRHGRMSSLWLLPVRWARSIILVSRPSPIGKPPAF